MMTEQEREALVNAANNGSYSGNMGCKLNGFCCSVAGWKNPDYATISPCNGGFYHADWETVKQVVEGDRQFSNLALTSWGWLGIGCNKDYRHCEG